LGAAEALPAVARLTAAIPAAPIAVFIVVVMNFTMGSLLSSLFSERELAIEVRTRCV
jgi:hypothetical protein